MADTESTEAYDDELLSAYVDGELDEEQRARVEQRLRDDQSAKQLVAELQELSKTLRALPREQVGKELRELVLQRTEEKLVTASSQEAGSYSSRRWTWAAMAVAAALFLMVYQPVEDQEEELAVAKPQVGRIEHSAPELRAPAAAMVAEESLNEIELDALAADEPVELAEEAAEQLFAVHLTVADVESGQQRFDELLVTNGIIVENEPPGEVASEEEGKKEQNAEAEVVLVEASRSQIEGLLQACNADVRNWDSLSFADQSDSSLPVPGWRGFEREGRAAAKSSLSGSGGESVVSGRALKARDQDDVKSSLSDSEGKGVEFQQQYSLRGRAKRLGADWSQLQLQAKASGGAEVRTRRGSKMKAATDVR
ncbi:MAG: anti-sigma factor family protein, partial [Aeoliella sp.]